MRVLPSFDPIDVGEIDAFAFDMTERVGASEIVSTQWSLSMTPFSSGADPNPGGRIGVTWVSTTATDNFGQQKTGWFVFAMIGPMPASAAGGTYTLRAVAWLADTRIVSDDSDLPCRLPGRR